MPIMETDDEIRPAHTNEATVMAIYEAFGRGDIDGLLEHVDEEVAWEAGAVDHGVPWLTPGRGHEHVRSFFAQLGTALDLEVVQPGPPLVNEQQVAVPCTVRGRVKATGKVVDDGGEIHLWTFGSHGKVVAFRHAVDTHQHWLALQS